MENYILACKRRLKATIENFYLLEVSIQKSVNNDIVCKILNSANKEYTIRIFDYTLDLYRFVVCSCPDSSLGGHICKHIYWLGLNKIGKINPENWTTQNLTLFFKKYELPNSSMPGRNDTCPICLDDINYDTHPTIRCIKGCDNCVHTKCWFKYVLISKLNNTYCVCCRQDTMPTWISYGAPVYFH